MKIGLVGAPGSGKTALAIELGEALDEKGTVGTLIDGYVEPLSERSDLALGPFATYMGNLYVALERAGLEHFAHGHESIDYSITCGTLIESAVYGIFTLQRSPTPLNEARTSSYMHILANLISDTWNYDFTFYLPGSDDTDFSQLVAEEIPGALDFTNAPVTKLEGDTRGRLKQALNFIEEKNGLPTVR